MYSIVGDYIRIGNSKRDPYHSTVVRSPQEGDTGYIVVSMNRCERRIRVHMWQLVHMADGSPDQVHPIGSYDASMAESAFRRDEKQRKRTGAIAWPNEEDR